MSDQNSSFGIKMSADASQLIAETDKSSKAQQTFAETMAKSQAASASAGDETKRFVERLKEQADTLGKSRTEIEHYRAEQLSLTDAQKQSVQASIAQIEAFEKTEKFASSVGTAFKAGTAALITYATTTAFAVKHIIDQRAELHNLGQSLGISTESLSIYNFQMSLAGVHQEGFSTAMRTLARNISESQSGIGRSAEVFKALGGGIYEAAKQGESMETLLPKIAERFAQFADGPNKTALALALFGRAGEQMIPMLNQGAAGFQAAAREAAEFNRIVGTDGARRADEFNTNLTRMNALLSASKHAIATDALPALNSYLEQLLYGVKLAGSFGGAIAMFGTTNPFRSPRENIVATDEKLATLQRGRDLLGDGPGAGSAKAAYDEKIEKAKREREWFLFLQRQDALQSVAGMDTSDSVSRIMARAGAKKQAPRLPGNTQSGISDGDQLIVSLENQLDAANGEASAYNKTMRQLYETGKEYSAEVATFALVLADEIDIQKAATDAANAAQRAHDEGTRAYQRSSEQIFKETDRLEASNQKLKEHIEQIGLTKENVDLLKVARAEDDLAMAEAALAMDSLRAQDDAYNQVLVRRVELLKEKVQLERQGAVAQAGADAAKKVQEEWTRTSNNIERSLTDAIVRGFDKGKSFTQNFIDSLQVAFKTAVLTPIIQPIVRPFAQAMASGMESLMGSMGFGAASGSARGMMGGGFGSLGGMFGQTGADFGNFFGSIGSIAEDGSVFGMGDAAMGFAAANPWATAAMLGGGLLLGGSLFGGGGGPKASQVGLIRQGADNHYSIGQINVPGGEGNYPLYESMLSRLNDPKQYDQGILGQYVDRYIGGGAGEGAQSMVQKLLQLIEPAHQAALKTQQDQLKTQQDTAASAAQQVQLQQQLLAQQGQLTQSMASVASGLSSKLGIDTLQSATDALAISDYRAPLDRFGSAKQQVDELFGKAMGGDLAAVQGFPQVVQSALGIGRDVFASGPQFQDFFLSSNRMLNDLLTHQRDVQTEILRDLPMSIQDSGNNTVAAIRELRNALVAKLGDVETQLRSFAA